MSPEGRGSSEPPRGDAPLGYGRGSERSMQCQLVHAIHGRLRFRIDEPEVFLYGPPALEAWLRGLPGVREARANAAGRSVVIVHDGEPDRDDELTHRLAEFDRVELRSIDPNGTPRGS